MNSKTLMNGTTILGLYIKKLWILTLNAYNVKKNLNHLLCLTPTCNVYMAKFVWTLIQTLILTWKVIDDHIMYIHGGAQHFVSFKCENESKTSVVFYNHMQCIHGEVCLQCVDKFKTLMNGMTTLALYIKKLWTLNVSDVKNNLNHLLCLTPTCIVYISTFENSVTHTPSFF